jgi:uncharacterized protein (TIGR02996 family)
VSPLASFAVGEPPELRCFFDSIVEAGGDLAPRLILADWLEEHDRPQEAELLRLQTALEATCCQPDQHPERVTQQARLVKLLAAGVRPCLPRRTVAPAESVEMTFAWIPPGTFLMGSPPEEAEHELFETRHRVTLTEGFYLGIHPVTQAQWQAVMGNNPSHFRGENLPVERVSWTDCRKLCTKWSQMDGQRYRLPTEAEWEYACRAGTTTPFHFGETMNTNQANYSGKYPYNKSKKGVDRQRTTPVGRFPPNGWGVFDMHGNVREWCADWYDVDYYERSPQQNPQGPGPRDSGVLMCGECRISRGGGWVSGGWSCRAAYRDKDLNQPSSCSGFRVVLVDGTRTKRVADRKRRGMKGAGRG